MVWDEAKVLALNEIYWRTFTETLYLVWKSQDHILVTARVPVNLNPQRLKGIDNKELKKHRNSLE